LTAEIFQVRRLSPTCKNTLAHFGVDYIATLIIHISLTMSGYDGPYDLLSRHWELLEGCQEGTNQNSSVHTAACKNHNTDVCSATPDNDYEQEDTTQRLSCKSCYRRKTKCSLVNTTEPECETCSQRGWTCESREPKTRHSQITSCWPCQKGKSKCVRSEQTATCVKCSHLGKDCTEFEPEPASPSDEGSQIGDAIFSQEAQVSHLNVSPFTH